jgi:hypothetical protein
MDPNLKAFLIFRLREDAITDGNIRSEIISNAG